MWFHWILFISSASALFCPTSYSGNNFIVRQSQLSATGQTEPVSFISSNEVKAVDRELGIEGLLFLRDELAASGTTALDSTAVSSINNALKRYVKTSRGKLGDSGERFLWSGKGMDSRAMNMNTPTLQKAVIGRSSLYSCIDIQEWNQKRRLQRVVVKQTKESGRYDAELRNYRSICGRTGSKEFIKIQDQIASPSGSLLILEAGTCDLRRFGIVGKKIARSELKMIYKAMVQALRKIHSKRLVWSDLKLENFIVVPKQQDNLNSIQQQVDAIISKSEPVSPMIDSSSYMVKACDLESAVAVGSALKDFSPEACAPEQADALAAGQLIVVGGRGADFKLNLQEPLIAEQALDIWALGISMLQLYIGRPPIVTRTDIRGAITVVQDFSAGRNDLGISEVDDPLLKRLLVSMLNPSPKKRPNINSVLASLYFATP